VSGTYPQVFESPKQSTDFSLVNIFFEYLGVTII